MDQPELNPYAALMHRKAQLLAQEQQAMGQPMPPQAPQPPVMPQAQFSGYPQQRPQMTPQQMQQLAALLQRRSQ